MKRTFGKILLLLLLCLVSPGRAFSVAEITPELISGFEGMALKDISKSETLKAKSHKHEFHGIKGFEDMLGTEKRTFEAELFYFSDGEVVEDRATVTWYYITPKSLGGKRYYTLYYQDNKVARLMEAGDLLLIGKKKGDSLAIVITKKNSRATAELLKLLKMENAEETSVPKAMMQKGDKQSDTTHLEKSGIDILKNASTGKLVINGPVSKYYDGDTIVLGDLFKIRMQGYDAPEKAQMCEDSKNKEYECGMESLEALQKIIGKGKIVCVHNGWDKYNRHLFTCRNSQGVEINRRMVAEGWGVSEYSAAYKNEEKVAASQKKGIWRGDFQRPNEWRKEHKRK